MRIKLTMFLMTCFLIQVSATGYGQTVTLDEKSRTVKQLFEEIRKQTGFNVIWSPEQIDEQQMLTLEVQNRQLKDVLEQIATLQQFEYSIQDRTIVIKEKMKPTAGKAASVWQNIDVQGKVTDTQGQALPRATVTIRGTQISVPTDENGHFQIAGVEEGQVLVISFLGYKTREVKAEKHMVIRLESSGEQLGEVEVMVGYGKVRRKDLTGSVSSISGKDIELIPAVTVDNVLMGRASGVQVTKADGQPGGSLRVQIRGAASITGDNEPLYVIDGVPIMPESPYISNANNDITGGVVSGAYERGISAISHLNLDDITSIDILKDASAAAIYGSRAANGVVIITTKNGQISGKPRFTVNAYGGISLAKRPHLLSASQFKEITREAALNNPTHSTSTQILSETTDYFYDTETDWVDLVRRNAAGSNLTASIAGGNLATRYYSSLSIRDQKGTEIGSDFQRFSGRTNLDFTVSDRFRMGANLNYNYSVSNVSMGLSRVAYQFRPDFPVYHEDGSFFISPDRLTVNPVALSTVTNMGRTFGFIGTAYGEWDITRSIRFKSSLTYGISNYIQEQFTPRYIRVSNNNVNEAGTGSRGYRLSDYNIWENTLTYQETFQDHHTVNVLFGNSFQENRMNYNLAVGTGFPDDFILNNLSSAALAYDVEGYTSGNGLASYFVRTNYSYRDRYLVTLTGRVDGSSKFSDRFQYGVFPSAAVAWRLSNEPFLQDQRWVDDLKIRFSLGKTGKQNIGDYLWRGLYESASYANEGGSYPSTIKNDQVKWEETNQTDWGLDFSFFNAKLFGTLGRYTKITDGLLITVDMPGSSGYDQVVANVGKTSNKGWELELNSDLIQKKNWRWTIGLIVSKNENRVLEIGGAAFSNPAQRGILNDAVVMEGEPLGTFYGYKVDGIFQSQTEIDELNAAAPNQVYQSVNTAPGDFKFIDVNGDGFINDLDRAVIGDANPDYYGGFNSSLRYRNFHVSAQFNYSIGNQLIWRLDQQQVVFYGDKNFTTHVLDHWSPDNTQSARPRAVIGDPANNRRFSDFFVHDASYLKLNTVSLMYEFPRNAMSKWGIQDVGVYATANNLFTITSYPGIDPEANSNPGSIFMGEDRSVYPPSRMFTFGLRANF